MTSEEGLHKKNIKEFLIMEDRISDDRPIEPSERIKNMSDEELEQEFQRLFGDILEDENEKDI